MGHTCHHGFAGLGQTLIDIMMTHKDGSSKEPTATLAFARRCVAAQEEVLTNKGAAAEHVSKKGIQVRQKRGTAAEHVSKQDNAAERVSKRVELDEDSVAACCQKLGRDLLERDLLPHQKKDTRYCLRFRFEGDSYLSTSQRSFTDNMLRKHLGSKQMAIHI
jgi:hypothetical protein